MAKTAARGYTRKRLGRSTLSTPAPPKAEDVPMNRGLHAAKAAKQDEMECYVDQSTLLILVHIRIFAFVGVAYVLCYSRVPAQTAYRGSDVFSDVTWTSALRGVNPSEGRAQDASHGRQHRVRSRVRRRSRCRLARKSGALRKHHGFRFQDIGVGLATGPGRGRIYWVQTFGAPRFGERR
jgi:hypothetical protein